ncbi:MAG: hypothetical protein OXC26_11840 [Albidovulum sp.]|nr:hypothetical protein [Albidovulum sp.]
MQQPDLIIIGFVDPSETSDGTYCMRHGARGASPNRQFGGTTKKAWKRCRIPLSTSSNG